MLRLKKMQGKEYNIALQPESIELRKPITRIGRTPALADVVMDSLVSPLMISRFHAQISHDNDSYTLECNGMNGILVNSVKRKKCVLRNGDVVVFGGAGVQTPEGRVVSTPESELVYVFECDEKDDKNNGSVKDVCTPKEVCTPRRKRPSVIKSENKWQKSSSKLSDNFISQSLVSSHLIDSQNSPGEGTSDGRVRVSKRRRRIKVLDSDDESPSQPERKHCRRSSVSSKLIRRSSSSTSNLVLDNTIEKVAKKVLPLDELEQREKAIQELLDRKSGKIGEWNIEIHAEYGPTGRNRLICDKCYSPVPNRYLHWRVFSPYSGATDHYHFSCFQPHTQVTVDQIQIASKVSAKDRKRVEKKIKS
ncbi:predicted protein [Nematostella vectensis]|uniref:FHA domain-containing protein n=1 Tax=Nematostella vectensis TaxID=45351 RepID=A7RTA7_NEMVE|nr:predicted protein [Nematostella vectensis]|eukprot:XP_001637498.1 predicted protein [Nematostella vectensis]